MTPVRKKAYLKRNKVFYSYTQIHTLTPTLGAGKIIQILDPSVFQGPSGLSFLKSVALGKHRAPPARPEGSQRQHYSRLLNQGGTGSRSSGNSLSPAWGWRGQAVSSSLCPIDTAGILPSPAPNSALEAEGGERLCRLVLHLQSPGDSAHSLGSGGPKAGVQSAILCKLGWPVAGFCIYTPVFSLIQFRNTGSLVYTPGLSL